MSSTTVLNVPDAKSIPKYSTKEYAFFGVAVVLVIIGIFTAVVRLFKGFGFGGSSAKEEKVAPEPTEEEKQYYMIQQREAEKQDFRDNADYYKTHMSTIMKEIEANQVQAQNNHVAFQRKFGTKKASFDDDLTTMEDEQNLETVFMTKDKIDEKKKEMIELGRSLGGQYQQLKQEYYQTHQYLMNLNNQWQQLYPDEAPLYQPPQTQQQQPQQQQQQMQMMQQQQQQRQQQYPPQQSSFTGDAVLSNDKGREQLPFS